MAPSMLAGTAADSAASDLAGPSPGQRFSLKGHKIPAVSGVPLGMRLEGHNILAVGVV